MPIEGFIAVLNLELTFSGVSSCLSLVSSVGLVGEYMPTAGGPSFFCETAVFCLFVAEPFWESISYKTDFQNLYRNVNYGSDLTFINITRKVYIRKD